MDTPVPKTYRDLKEALNELTEEQLDFFVSVVIVDKSTPDECEIYNMHHTVLADDAMFSGHGLDLEDNPAFEDLEDNLPLLVVER